MENRTTKVTKEHGNISNDKLSILCKFADRKIGGKVGGSLFCANAKAKTPRAANTKNMHANIHKTIKLTPSDIGTTKITPMKMLIRTRKVVDKSPARPG